MVMLNQFFAIIADGIKKKKVIVIVPLKNFILNILWVLYKNGYICGYNVQGKFVEVQLKYVEEKNTISLVKQISLISKRIYLKNKILKKNSVIGGTYIISNSAGVGLLTKNILSKKKFSGELLVKFN